jgi:hypothetical protein
MARSCPSSDGLRRVPMSDVAMKLPVTHDIEKYNLAIVRHVRVRLKAADGRFQILNIRHPRVTEKLVSR